MNQTYTHAMTLRLTTEIDELVTEAAYDRRMTKTDWIRFSIRRALGDHGTRITRRESK